MTESKTKCARESGEPAEVVGLALIDSYITDEEQAEFMKFIDSQKWSSALKRKTQQYGYEYNYASASSKPVKTTAIPSVFDKLVQRLVTDGHFKEAPDQLIINNYEPGQGISAHTDHKFHFGPVVASVSLLSPCNMQFATVVGGRTSWERTLRAGSLLVLKGDARYKTTHAIASRLVDKDTDVSEPQKTVEFRRQRRVSLTFRNMKK